MVADAWSLNAWSEGLEFSGVSWARPIMERREYIPSCENDLKRSLFAHFLLTKLQLLMSFQIHQKSLVPLSLSLKCVRKEHGGSFFSINTINKTLIALLCLGLDGFSSNS